MPQCSQQSACSVEMSGKGGRSSSPSPKPASSKRPRPTPASNGSDSETASEGEDEDTILADVFLGAELPFKRRSVNLEKKQYWRRLKPLILHEHYELLPPSEPTCEFPVAFLVLVSSPQLKASSVHIHAFGIFHPCIWFFSHKL